MPAHPERVRRQYLKELAAADLEAFLDQHRPAAPTAPVPPEAFTTAAVPYVGEPGELWVRWRDVRHLYQPQEETK